MSRNCKRNPAYRITRIALVYFNSKKIFQTGKVQNRKLTNLYPRFNENKLLNPLSEVLQTTNSELKFKYIALNL